jgi:steroid delta-isomerase-like uncharacterized protein
MSELRSLVDRHYEGINRHDLEMAVAVLSDEVESILPGGPPMNGVEPFKGYVRVFWTAAPDAHIEGHRYFESGDTIVVEGTYSGTHTGPLMTPAGEIPATGRHFAFTFCDVLQARDGKVSSHRVYFDQVDFLSQLGLMPGPPPA